MSGPSILSTRATPLVEKTLHSLPLCCLAAIVAIFIPDLLLIGVLELLVKWQWMTLPADPFGPKAGIAQFLGSTVFAPIVETYILSWVLDSFGSLAKRPVILATIGATFFAALHGLFAGWLWFVGTWWAFFVLSFCYVLWRPSSYKEAFLAACIPHAVLNGIFFALA